MPSQLLEKVMQMAVEQIETCIDSCYRELVRRLSTVETPHENLAKFLRTLRADQGLSLQQMADKIKGTLSKQSLYQYEKGKMGVPSRRASAIEKAYCRTPDERTEFRRRLQLPLDAALHEELDELKKLARNFFLQRHGPAP